MIYFSKLKFKPSHTKTLLSKSQYEEEMLKVYYYLVSTDYELTIIFRKK